MLTPDYLQNIPYQMEQLTLDLEEALLEDISRRIAKTGYITDTAEYQLLRLKELGAATDYITARVAEYTQLSETTINAMFFDAAQTSTEFYEELYKATGKPFIPAAENLYLQQLIKAGTAQTKETLVNFTQSMGFAVIENGERVFLPIAKTYQKILDTAHMQVMTGAFDYNTAVRNAVKQLTENGLQFIDYETGWRNRCDVAARRAVLTGISQMSGKISEQVMRDLDTDIVEVTAHAGARPDHAVWQGKWYRYKVR